MDGPDVGYAWMVALAACMMNFIMAGLGRLSGILFVAFMEIFQVDRKSGSVPLSVRSSARNLFGPVVGILGQKYGPRKMMITGGILGTISAALCFFAPNILWITILWGGVNGMSTAMSVTLSQVVIGQYFKKYRTTAAGIGFSGGCVGSFMFPALLEYFLQNYGLEGTFFIIASVIMHVIPAAMILRKPPWLQKGKQNKVVNQKPISTVSQSLDNLVKEEIEDECVANNKDVNIHSIKECAPKRFYSESSGDKSLAFSNLEELEKSPNENGYVPEKNSQKILKLNIDEQPDITFLRENSRIVIKLLSLKESENGINIISETNPFQCNIMEELESLYNIYLSLQGKFELNRNLCHLKNNSLQDELRDDFKSVSSSMNRSFNLKKRFSESELPKVHSVPEIAKIYDGSSKTFLLKKLSEIINGNEQLILENFQEEKCKAVLVLKEFRKLTKINLNMENVITNLSEEKRISAEDIPDKAKNESHSNSFAVHIKTAVKLYANPLFLMVCFCRSVHFITFVTAMTTVVDFSIDKGLQRYDGKYVIAALSFGDLVGRLCLGWITDKGFMNLPKYMMVFMVVQGICTATLPMMHTKVAIYTGLAVFGMLQGSLFVRHPVLISKYLRSHEQSIAMGCANLFSGLLGFALPVYIGYFRDQVGSYDYIFYINGLIGACVGLLWVFEPFFLRCVNASRSEQKIPV